MDEGSIEVEKQTLEGKLNQIVTAQADWRLAMMKVAAIGDRDSSTVIKGVRRVYQPKVRATLFRQKVDYLGKHAENLGVAGGALVSLRVSRDRIIAETYLHWNFIALYFWGKCRGFGEIRWR